MYLNLALLGSFQNYSDVGLFILRITIGVLFVIHGIPKLRGESRTKERNMMKGLGVPHALFDLVAVYEFLGGALLLVGLLTQIVSILFIVLMSPIIYFNITKMSKPPMNKRYINGWDRDTVLLAGIFLFLIIGPGLYSVDALLGI